MTQTGPQRIIDKRRLSAFLRRAERRLVTRAGGDFLLSRIADELAFRLSVTNRRFERVLIVSPAARWMAPVLERHAARPEVSISAVKDVTSEVLATSRRDFDLVVSVGHLNLVDDVPGMLIQMRQAMVADGLLVACVPGSMSLQNLREAMLSVEAEISGGASPRFMPLFDIRAAGGLLQRAGFALPVCDSDEVDVRYGDVWSLVGDIRTLGASNVLVAAQGRPLSKAFVSALDARLKAQSAVTGSRFEVVYDCLWMSGWAPHESQPKPLEPGSATVPLTQVLGDKSE
ncbi:MAG: SAM-dependent methyltransferase [Pseudomonadota bacterium]